MNRRRFLKYASATVVVVGASALGLNYFRNSPQIPSQQTSEAEIATSSILSATSVSNTLGSSLQFASLQGRLFFDHNGDGIQDGDEPGVQGAKVQLAKPSVVGDSVVAEALTDTAGDWKLDVPEGSYTLFVNADPKFRNMCTTDEEITAISEGYLIDLTESQVMNIGLMIGHETFPFLRRFEAGDVRYFVDDGDVENPSDPKFRDWQGGQRTYKGHQGFDILSDIDTPVVAAAPGVVIGAEDKWESNPDLTWIGNRVVIDHLNGFRTAYNHLDGIKVNYKKLDLTPPDLSTLQHVKRGEIIAFSGQTGTQAGPVPHLHFEAWPATYRYFGLGRGWVIDHFRDLYYGQHGRALFSNEYSLWTKDNDVVSPEA